MIPTDEKLIAGFETLVSQLSPENLTCDGELSKSQVNARLKKLNAEWKALEKQAGHTVCHGEMEDFLYQRVRVKYGL